ncbi:MAG: hypothetical protein JW953_21635 [Anaerolineae bacterium]|nr:hypothetical protein [Anaerolineae bacterium]
MSNYKIFNKGNKKSKALLGRIAISNGDRARKDNACRLLGALDYSQVTNWNNYLYTEILRKIRHATLSDQSQLYG